MKTVKLSYPLLRLIALDLFYVDLVYGYGHAVEAFFLLLHAVFCNRTSNRFSFDNDFTESTLPYKVGM